MWAELAWAELVLGQVVLHPTLGSVRIIQSIIIRIVDSTVRRSSGYNVYHNTAYTTVTPM